MRKIRLAVIGTGLAWKRLHWPAIQALNDKYEVVALCNRTKVDAENFANTINLDSSNVYENHHELLKRTDIDAVDVIVPIEQNYDIAADVIKANKNLIAEKPLAASLEGAQRLVNLQKQHNTLVMVAENFRYNDEMNQIRDIISQGKIGKVIYFIKNNVVDFESEMKNDTYAAKEWRQHPNYKGGAFFDAAIHDIAGMRHIFGNVDHVFAMGIPQQEDFNPYISVNAQMLFANGVIGQFSYYPDGQETQKPLIGFRIFGMNGEIYLENKMGGIINISYRDGRQEQVNFIPKHGFYNEFLNFYNAFNGLEDIKVTPEVAYGDVKMMFDILTSIETQRQVYVDAPQIEDDDARYSLHQNLYGVHDTSEYLH